MGKPSRVRTNVTPEGEPSPKRLKKNNNDDAGHDDESLIVVTERPKSKKELRAEKKAAKKAATAAATAVIKSSSEPLSREEYKLQKQKERKERRREQFKEQLREKRVEKKIRQQKRQNREMNAPRTAKRQLQNNKGEDPSITKSKSTGKNPTNNKEQEVAMKVLSEVIHGSKDDRSGMTTLQMGVQYKDVVVGTGVMAKNKSLLTMSYKLTGGKFGAVLDSSKSFKFRLGKGEVIQGWDIGCQGMREGGRRKLVVPPKAGYGSQDIGAGPGATLFFDITLLSVR